MTQPKYFLVKFRSPTYYNEDKRIIVDSQKQLKDFVKNEARFMLEEFENRSKIPRMHTQHMYIDEDEKPRIIGKVFSFGKLGDSEENNDDLHHELEYWCEKIAKKDLYKFAGFERVQK